MILFLTECRESGIRICKQLLAAGVPVRWAKPDAGVSLCRNCDTCGVILDGRHRISVAERLCVQLTDLYPELPVAILLSPITFTPSNATRLIRDTGDENALTENMIAFCRESCGMLPSLSTHALTIGEKPEDTRFLGYPLHVSPTGWNILRVLFLRAPKPVRKEELFAVCFPEFTQQNSNLTAQIKQINRETLRIAGFRLIESIYGFGYRLCGGIVRNNKNAEIPHVWESPAIPCSAYNESDLPLHESEDPIPDVDDFPLSGIK